MSHAKLEICTNRAVELLRREEIEKYDRQHNERGKVDCFICRFDELDARSLVQKYNTEHNLIN